MNNKTIITIIVIAVVVGSYYWFTSSDNFVDNTIKNTEEEVEQSEQDRIVLGFLDKYDINTEIPSNLKYTFQLEDEFITKGKPIIFTAMLDDIFRQDNKLLLKFAPSFFDFSEPRIFYTLDGCADKIDTLISKEKDQWGEYAVVAKITSIEKPILNVEGSAYADEVELELAQSQTYLATGTCLDLEYIEDAGINALFD